MNEILKNMYTRHSTREFNNNEVENEKIVEILKAGTYAPTALNRQNLAFYALKNKEKLKKVLDYLDGGKQYYNCSVIIFIIEKTVDKFTDYNTGAAMENMLLAANSLKLSSCWINCTKDLLNKEEGKKILKDVLDLDYLPTVAQSIALGYSDAAISLKIKSEEYKII